MELCKSKVTHVGLITVILFGRKCKMYEGLILLFLVKMTLFSLVKLGSDLEKISKEMKFYSFS